MVKSFKEFSELFEQRIEQQGFHSFEHGHTRIDYSVHPSQPKHVEIHMVLTHKDHQGEGSARAAMNEFHKHTDKDGITTHLTPEPLNNETKKTKLEKFYKSVGYVKNAGKNKDFSTRSTMLRHPQ